MNFTALQDVWQKVFDDYLSKQGENITFYVKALPTGAGVDDIWHSALNYSGAVVDSLTPYVVQGLVFRDLYGSKTPESEVFAVQEVGQFEPGDVVVQSLKEDIEATFGGAIPFERVKYVTLGADTWNEKYIIKDIITRGLGTPPYIVDIFLRKSNKET